MDFIPQAQLPYGMAEQLIRLKSQSGDAWAALAQHLGQTVGGALQNRAEQQQKTLTPEQLDAIRSYTTQPSGRQIPGQNGDPGITIGQSANQPLDKSMFPRGIPAPGMQLIEQANKNKESEALARMTTDRIMGAQGLKNDAASNKVNIPVTDTTRALFKKAGLPLADDTTTVRHEDYDAAVKTALGAQKSSGKSDPSNKRLTAFSEALDENKGRAGAFGTSKTVFDRAERLESLATNLPNLRSSEIEELAIGLNAMLSGSNTGAQEQVKALVPNTAWGNAKKFKEWFTNEPTGTDQQEFVKRMMGSVAREKATAAEQLIRTKLSRTQGFSDVEKAHPQEYENIMRSHGVDPERYKTWKAGGFKPFSAVQSPGEKGQVDKSKDPLGIF